MKQYRKAGVVACSNGLSMDAKQEMEQLKRIMENQGVELVFSDVLYAKEGVRNGTGKERANALMKFYCDDSIEVIFDVSGGDVAQEVLEHLDYEKIGNSRNSAGEIKEFWGYSDLTVLLNAIYERTGNVGVLYQVRYIEHMLEGLSSLPHTERTTLFREGLCVSSDCEMFQPSYHFLQGTEMSGIVVGGNVRCLLKLAGTKYFPDMTGKLLFLEARSGLEPQMRSYLGQLQQMGVFEKISGLFLGTFTQWENELTGVYVLQKDASSRTDVMTMEKLVLEYVPMDLPIAKTYEVGHAPTSSALCIGKELYLVKDKNN